MQKRKKNFEHLLEGLRSAASAKGFDIEDKLIMPVAETHSDPSWFGFMMTCREGIDRKAVVESVEAAGVQTRALFAGNLTKHPCFDEMRLTGRGYRIVGDLAGTDRIMKDSFWVGVYPGMTDAMLDHMCKVICEAVKD